MIDYNFFSNMLMQTDTNPEMHGFKNNQNKMDTLKLLLSWKQKCIFHKLHTF